MGSAVGKSGVTEIPRCSIGSPSWKADVIVVVKVSPFVAKESA
jgi:hypothetical protein